MGRLSYRTAGVDYASLDPFKIAAQRSAIATATMLERHGVHEIEASRGESAYLIELPDRYLAFAEEGLGTKNLVAQGTPEVSGEQWYANIAHDCVAMIVNDLITVGALPLATAMHLAVGDADILDPEAPEFALIQGWRSACEEAGCAWGPGETPTLKDIVIPGTFVLNGSAVGQIYPKDRLLIPPRIQASDRIIMFASTGLHANGYTLARSLASRLPDGFRTCMPDGQTYGQALLQTTQIYVGLMKWLLKEGMEVHAAINITGHGWRKLMRANEPFVYVIDHLPPVPSIFTFIQEQGSVELNEMYSTFNMGAGFAVIVPPKMTDRIIKIAMHCGIRAWNVGEVRAEGNRKAVLIPSLNLEFEGGTLNIRP